jgi:glycosyltransferase involved in cell wall biosynthesis
VDLAAAVHDGINPKDLRDLEVAVVHYWLVSWRGGEKVIESILKLFPRADLYTLFYDAPRCPSSLRERNIYTSCLDRPWLRPHYQKLFPLYPAGIRSLRLRKSYDLIISSESGPAKGIANPDRIPHLCYVHTPMRYCWGFTSTYLDSLPVWLRSPAAFGLERLRRWDLSTIDGVDHYVANSRNVADRVRRFYRKSAAVCYPPIALDLFADGIEKNRRHQYLSFGAITPYKNIGLLVDTFNQLDRKLMVIGSGSEGEKLARRAGPNITFMGSLPIEKVLTYIKDSRALLFPGEEDFGMIPLEVMSQGVPVIALKKGGALETVVENLTDPARSSGVFFDTADIPSLKAALSTFESIEDRFDPFWIRQHARGFGEDRFHLEFTRQVLQVLRRNAGSAS